MDLHNYTTHLSDSSFSMYLACLTAEWSECTSNLFHVATHVTSYSLALAVLLGNVPPESSSGLVQCSQFPAPGEKHNMMNATCYKQFIFFVIIMSQCQTHAAKVYHLSSRSQT